MDPGVQSMYYAKVRLQDGVGRQYLYPVDNL